MSSSITTKSYHWWFPKFSCPLEDSKVKPILRSCGQEPQRMKNYAPKDLPFYFNTFGPIKNSPSWRQWWVAIVPFSRQAASIFDKARGIVEKSNDQASLKWQQYLVILSLDSARALQIPVFRKGERKMAKLEIYNFDHVVGRRWSSLSITLQSKQLICSIAGSVYLPCQRSHPFGQRNRDKKRT